jgi:hypothetical protein
MSANILTIGDVEFRRAKEWTERLAALLIQQKHPEGQIALINKAGKKILVVGYDTTGTKPSEEKRGHVTEVHSLGLSSKVSLINEAIALAAKHQLLCQIESLLQKNVVTGEQINHAIIKKRCENILFTLQSTTSIKFYGAGKKNLTATEQAIVDLLRNNVNLDNIHTPYDAQKMLAQIQNPPALKNTY